MFWCMRLIVILNGTKQKVKRFNQTWRSSLESQFDIDIRSTSYAGHAEVLARIASEENPNGILAAGGDGTLSQVLNGVLSSSKKTSIGIIPLGTGNDFARMCRIRRPDQLIASIKKGGLATDVGCIERVGDPNRYYINAASLGMGPDVVKRLENDSRWLGADLTYLKSTIRSFFGYQPEEVKIRWQGKEWAGQIRSVAIANGKTFGSGLAVAPDAVLSDGLLNLFIAGDVPLLQFLYFLGKIRAGKKVKHHQATYSNSNEISIESNEIVWIEADGEIVGKTPAKFTVLPGAIQFFRKD